MVSPVSADMAFQSYGRCIKSESFFEDFYSIFHGKSDVIRNMFTNTDMMQQRHLLRAGILWLLMHARGAPGNKLKHLATTHSRTGYNVSPALYGLWVDALMETIERHDPEYSKELDGYWRESLAPGIKIIQEGW